MAKPRRALGQLRAFRSAMNKYTGRRLLRAPLRPITRLIPSPAAILLRALGL